MTADALIALSDTFYGFSTQLDGYIKSSADPFSPLMQQLRTMDTQIAMDAAILARLAVEELAPDVEDAIAELSHAVDEGKGVLKTLDHVKKALSIVAAVLSAAASISTGNPLAAATAVLSLAQTVTGAVSAASH